MKGKFMHELFNIHWKVKKCYNNNMINVTLATRQRLRCWRCERERGKWGWNFNDAIFIFFFHGIFYMYIIYTYILQTVITIIIILFRNLKQYIKKSQAIYSQQQMRKKGKNDHLVKIALTAKQPFVHLLAFL